MSMNTENWYYFLLAKLLATRRENRDDTHILDSMDLLWYSLDSDAIARVNEISSKLAQGTIREEDFIRLNSPMQMFSRLEANRTASTSFAFAGAVQRTPTPSSASYCVVPVAEVAYA
jgi:hypothetical protein